MKSKPVLVVGLTCKHCGGLLDTRGNPPFYCPKCGKPVVGDNETEKEKGTVDKTAPCN